MNLIKIFFLLIFVTFLLSADGSTLGGTVFLDEDKDGIFDSDENIISKVHIRLFHDVNNDGHICPHVGDILVSETDTDGSGAYQFNDIADGNYLVQVMVNDPDIPSSSKLTTTNPFDVTVKGADVTGIDLAFLEPTTPQSNSHDYGDAPSSYPGDDGTNNDARHRVVDGVHLGLFIDVDGDGSAEDDENSDDSLADDNRDQDDEDGVQLLDPLIPGKNARVRVLASVDTAHKAILKAFFDLDGNNQWYDEGDEILINNSDVKNGVTIYTIKIPDSATNGDDGKSFVRFKYWDDRGSGGTCCWAEADSGEVEDYEINIGASYTIAGTVFEDKNHNNKKDDTESGIANVKVGLYKDFDRDGVVDSTDIVQEIDSDANGNYLFTVPPNLDISRGDYLVIVDTADSDIDSDLKLKGANPLEATMNNSNISGLDFPFSSNPTPIVDIETHTNGKDADTEDEAVALTAGDEITWSYIVRNIGEIALKDIVVTDDIEGVISCSQTTLDIDESITCEKSGEAVEGNYTNIGLVTAMADCGEEECEDTNDSDPSHYKAEAKPLSSLGDKVWGDTNGNGLQDDGENGIDKVTVNLYKDGDKVANTTTSDGGKYGFASLESGNYMVEFIIPDGYTATKKGSGTNNDSDIDSNGKTDTIVLGEGENNLDIDAGLTKLIISGHLYDDGNGDGDINGKAISSVEGKDIFVNLIDSNNKLLSSKKIVDGAYSFNSSNGVNPNSKYTIVLSIVESGTKPELPKDWNNADGENVGLKGNDGDANGIVSVSVENISVYEVNFGINKKPLAEDKKEESQPNPGTDIQVKVPKLLISDNEDGTPTTITITSISDNAKLYYNGVVIEKGKPIEKFEADKFTVDPDNGDQTVVFTYTTTDKAGVISDEATVTLPFTDILISGKLFDDGNHNGSVDGDLISSADSTSLYVTLVDSNGNKVASKALVDGLYSFSNVDGLKPNSDYSIVLTDTLDSTTAHLPSSWTNADGENIGTTGLDSASDGKIAVSVVDKNIENINFGINKRPIAEDKTENPQINPGSDTQVAVPTLIIGDKEDTTPTIITITELPTNATLYYNGTPVTKDTEITDVNSSKFTIDPQDGDVTAIFKYTTTDVTGAISEVATVTMPFTSLQISGHIFNDGNNDGIVNGTGISAPNGVQLYVTLLDSDGELLKSKEVASNGSYKFGDTDGILPDSNYTVVLSTTEDKLTPDLPENWTNLDGEHIGIDAGTDGDNNGIISVPVAKVNVVEVNFGINKKPVAGDYTEPKQLNPGGDVQVDVPDLNVTDNEDGTPKIVTIETIPSHGVLYYNSEVVTAGQVIENLNNTLLTLDPDNGDQVVSFTYTTTDRAGVKSEIATISMSFKGLKISGNIFDDGDNDGTVNGTPISLVDGVQLHATLLDNRGVSIATMPINVDGSYQFDGVDGIIPNSNYSVVLSIESNSTLASLPSNWNNKDGEHIGTGIGLDDISNGKIDVSVVDVDIPEVNFGINRQPIAKDNNAQEQINPGDNTQVVVPTLELIDSDSCQEPVLMLSKTSNISQLKAADDGENCLPTVVTIKTLPDNGILYYDGKKITINQVIEEFTNSKLTVDPDDGNQLIVFDYTTTDRAGFESEIARVKMPFVGIKISGNVFDDGNGDGSVNGVKVSLAGDVPLFINLLNEKGDLISTYPLDSDIGMYSFDGNDSVTANTNYRVILTTDENGTTPLLPTDWNNRDGENIGLVGLDGLSDGAIDVNISTSNIIDINFGINERPTTQNVESKLVQNPNSRVQVIDLLPKDREDGVPKIVTINTLPTGGILYYDDIAVVVDQNITDFNNSKLTVQPNSGNTAVVFTYSATDSTGWSSVEPSRVRMPFYVPAPVTYGSGDTTNNTPKEEEQSSNPNTPPQEDEGVETEEQPVIYNLDITDDAVDANTEGSTTVIDVLSNDAIGEGVTIRLIDIEEGEVLWNEGTAVGGTNLSTTDSLVVSGEGIWEVIDGTITFTAEDGFDGTPTPIYYLVEDQQGNQSNVAEVSIKTDCTCETYESKSSDSVSALENSGVILLILVQMLTFLFLFRKEELEVK